VIRVSEEAKRLLSTLWAPDGEVMRLVLRQPEADEGGGLAFGHGRGEGADQIVQHAGTQVLRVDRSVRRGTSMAPAWRPWPSPARSGRYPRG
jgi:hypothetical protein